MNKRENIPVYWQLIQYVKLGFANLDKTIQHEIVDFIKSRQHRSGGFVNRGGNPDLYYSLFGFWLSLATNSKPKTEKLKEYLAQQEGNGQLRAIEKMALVLIGTELFSSKKHSLFSLMKIIFSTGKKIDISYRFFLLTLAIDAQNRNKKLYYSFARVALFFYTPKGNLPCSLVAALTFAKKTVGLKFGKEQQKLLTYYSEGVGFRAFEQVLTADALSTGVALFVLRETGYDLRLLAPDCLAFVQGNYNEGGFLSGDGDKTLDLEYTFYGLLALGSILKNEG